MPKQVYVGLSGGVDSSVAAALLRQSGYAVTGVYMKNWTRDVGGFSCPWQQDYQDAKRAAVEIGIPFKVFDFEKDYQDKVVDYMIEEYRIGRTPNPDVMCNQEIKFKLFLDRSLKEGADLIATGHYARIKDHQLYVGLDTNKDQSYFLYRMSQTALSRTLMPIGELKKTQVRALARKLGLVTADKKDSQGICFIGSIDVNDFLASYVKTRSGPIVDQRGKTVGTHNGALFYTIGQRHGLGVGGGLPYYVTGKDIKANKVFVTTDLQDSGLWKSKFEFSAAHWLGKPPEPEVNYSIRTRYRAPLIKIKQISKISSLKWRVELDDEVRAVTPGQSAVIYQAERVVGGGIIG
jgi:tRNA-specific 2-thiouridylase